MARQREFDEATALEAAMACFWRRGYEATSMHELTASIGISGPSLYSAFGGKRPLFTAALERHFDQSPPGRASSGWRHRGPRKTRRSFSAR
jgi:TetR/AcrR family transcriptional repressor of nem operon